MAANLSKIFPPLGWGRAYSGELLAADSLAALVVVIMLIPQSLAYALLAGLPAEMGLYASILPLAAYALLGTSRTLSVGPVAVISLMTAAAVGEVAGAGGAGYIVAAVTLALLSGLILLLMGLLRFGFLANFLSQPVVSGFITAAGVIIACGQLRHLLGVAGHGSSLPEILGSLWRHGGEFNPLTLATGLAAIIFLAWSRRGLQPLLLRLGLAQRVVEILARAGPIVAVACATLAAYLGGFDSRGVALVGEVPQGLPALALPRVDAALWSELAPAALLIAVIGFVESVSVGKTLAAKRRQRIDADQELLALGAANVASAVSSGFPVSGGFSRSVVNFEAGARTPAAGILAALGIALIALLATPWLYYLPKAVLAATIIVAVVPLLDFDLLPKAWRYSRSDFTAVAVTLVITLVFGVELGVLSGILCSVALQLYKTTHPHIAVVGAVPGTEHFRNVERHNVITQSNLVSLRVDESLYFANAAYLEDYIYGLVAEHTGLQHLILQCTAVNEIDMSALQALESIDHRLGEQGISLHLSEVKGPVMDRLAGSGFLENLSGRVFLTHYQAVKALRPDEPEPYII